MLKAVHTDCQKDNGMSEETRTSTRGDLPFTGERVVPGKVDPWCYSLHVKAYEYARTFVSANSNVLDAGCGVGYGAQSLARVASRVVGIDVSLEAVDYAASRYSAPNLWFLVADVEHLPFKAEAFDVVCCFEVIEHLGKPEQLLAEAGRVLARGGVCLLTTPQARPRHKPLWSPFHVHEFSLSEFRELLLSHFAEVQILTVVARETWLSRFLAAIRLLALRRSLLESHGRRLAARLQQAGTSAESEGTPVAMVLSTRVTAHSQALLAACRRPKQG